MNQTSYHVLLEGRAVGPYDRRTIVGMRIKKALTSDHVLIGTDGGQLTVADLIGQRRPTPFSPERSGSFSVVRATYCVSLASAPCAELGLPAFRGEVEARVQADVLRLAGRYRRGLRWREDRIKLALGDVAEAGLRGTQVDLWFRSDSSGPPQRVTLELFARESAREFLSWFPQAVLRAEDTAAEPGPVRADTAIPHGVWIATAAVALVAITLVAVLASRR